jgi:hypothetical protein
MFWQPFFPINIGTRTNGLRIFWEQANCVFFAFKQTRFKTNEESSNNELQLLAFEQTGCILRR